MLVDVEEGWEWRNGRTEVDQGAKSLREGWERLEIGRRYRETREKAYSFSCSTKQTSSCPTQACGKFINE